MPEIRSDPYSFSYGIDSVVDAGPTPVELPVRARLRPAEKLLAPQLDALLALPNIDDFIASQLAPYLKDVSILSPARFREVLAQTSFGLRFAAESRPHAARSLGGAAGLLADEIRMRELLQMYLTALLEV